MYNVYKECTHYIVENKLLKTMMPNHNLSVLYKVLANFSIAMLSKDKSRYYMTNIRFQINEFSKNIYFPHRLILPGAPRVNHIRKNYEKHILLEAYWVAWFFASNPNGPVAALCVMCGDARFEQLQQMKNSEQMFLFYLNFGSFEICVEI